MYIRQFAWNIKKLTVDESCKLHLVSFYSSHQKQNMPFSHVQNDCQERINSIQISTLPYVEHKRLISVSAARKKHNKIKDRRNLKVSSEKPSLMKIIG